MPPERKVRFVRRRSARVPHAAFHTAPLGRFLLLSFQENCCMTLGTGREKADSQCEGSVWILGTSEVNDFGPYVGSVRLVQGI